MMIFKALLAIVREFQQFGVRHVERGQQFAIRFKFKGENVVQGNLGPIENTHNRADHVLDVPHGGYSLPYCHASSWRSIPSSHGSGEIADEEYGKRDDDGGDPKEENVSNVMPGYALPFWDISNNRGWLARR